MSRGTDVRDEIISSIKELLGSEQQVEPFSLLIYERAEFKEKPLVLVRVAGREYFADQGPDQMMLIIDVLVAAAIPPKTSTTFAEYRREIVSHYDTFDLLFEQVLSLWVPNGPFSQVAMGDHRFSSIEEVNGFEMDELFSDGVYLSWIQLKYQDCLDEG